MTIVILDAATADQGADCWQALRAIAPLSIYERSSPAEARERVAEAQLVLTNKVPITADLLAAAPALRYVGVLATGYNVVDVAACQARGIAVTNIPAYSTQSVAQLVFAFLLHHAQRVADHAAAVRTGRWSDGPDFCFTVAPLRELHGRCLAIVGSGAIGSAVAQIGEGFGMRILRCAVPGSTSTERVPLAEALPQADVVSLHCPLTPTTTKLVNADFLAQMRPDAVLVNTGRGDLIDEPALIAALAAGHLAAVCLDVLSSEPPPVNHPLLNPSAAWTERLFITPHIGWATVEARARLVAEACNNVQAFLAGERRNRVD